jgi:hypothetical protein
MTRTDTATTEIIDTLDSFYCYKRHRRPMGRRGDQPARGPGDLPARRRTGRGRRPRPRRRTSAGGPDRRPRGGITADPRQLPDRSVPVEFALPDCSDATSIGEYGLQRLNIIIGAYETFLDRVRGTDDLSFHTVLDLLAAETHQRADLQAALARRS